MTATIFTLSVLCLRVLYVAFQAHWEAKENLQLAKTQFEYDRTIFFIDHGV
jgi:hypothetical protein